MFGHGHIHLLITFFLQSTCVFYQREKKISRYCKKKEKEKKKLKEFYIIILFFWSLNENFVLNFNWCQVYRLIVRTHCKQEGIISTCLLREWIPRSKKRKSNAFLSVFFTINICFKLPCLNILSNNSNSFSSHPQDYLILLFLIRKS